MFTAALFVIAQMWKHGKCSSTDAWVRKRDTHTGILAEKKKEGNPASCNDMDGPCGQYAKCSKRERGKHYTIKLT